MIFLGPPVSFTAPSKRLVIKSPDFYYLIHQEPKMAMKGMNNLAQVMASRFKGPEDFPNL
jgi:hypothetical protein